MKLSYKQIAIFGQVKVDVNALDCALTNYTTLLDLYKQGWWVTDRFGTIITIVRPRNNLKDGFCCVCRRIETKVNLNTLDLITQQIAEIKYEKYKQYLQSKQYSDKIKKSKVDYGKNSVSTLRKGDRNDSRNVLFTSQRTNSTKV